MLITMLSDYTFKNKAFQRNVEYEVTDDTAAALFAAGVARVAAQADYNQNTFARIDPSTGAVLDGFGNPVSVDNVISTGSTWRMAQNALNTGRLTVAYDIVLDEPLLIGSGTRIEVKPGVCVKSGGSRFHNTLRVGNSDYLESQRCIEGTWIYCADTQGQYVEGTLTYTHPAATLTWQVDGSPAGAPISIAAVTDAATSGVFEIPGGAAGQSLYVHVVPNGARTSTRSRRVRIEPITGAEPVTWSRTAGVLTIFEPGHNRLPGDFVRVFGSGVEGHWFIETSEIGASYTVKDVRSNASGTARVYSVSDLVINASGSYWDGSRGELIGPNSGMASHQWVLHSCNRVTGKAPSMTRTHKYAIFGLGVSDFHFDGLKLYGPTSTNSDGYHINGPARQVTGTNISGSAGDNMYATGSSDIVEYALFFPTLGTLDVDGVTIRNLRGDGTKTELARLYSGNAGWLKNIIIDGVHGTLDAATNSAVAVMTDTVTGNFVDGGVTNIDGLTISNVTAKRADGSHVPKVIISGSGVRRNIRIDNVELQPNGRVTAGTISLSGTFEDIKITRLRCATKFCGPAVDVKATAVGKSLVVSDVRFTADAQVQGVTDGVGTVGAMGVRPAVVSITAGASISTLDLIDIDVSEDSASGSRSSIVVDGVGLPSVAFRNLKHRTGATNPDSAIRRGAGSATNILSFSGVVSDADFLIANDATVPQLIQLQGVRHSRGNTINNGSAVAVGCAIQVGGDVQVNNMLNVPVSGPLFRVGSSSSAQFDGTKLDPTVVNHAPGASFYNTAAGFGAGVGQYVRGATSWTRVAA